MSYTLRKAMESFSCRHCSRNHAFRSPDLSKLFHLSILPFPFCKADLPVLQVQRPIWSTHSELGQGDQNEEGKA